MDPYHLLLDMWLVHLPKEAQSCAKWRVGSLVDFEVTEADIIQAVRLNLKHPKLDAKTFGTGLIPANNRALFDGAEVLKARLPKASQPG